MKSILAAMSALALATVSATACPFMKTAEHQTMSVASIEDVQTPMSTTEHAASDDIVVDDVTTGSVEDSETEAAE